jgi:hypothetical protein
MGLQNHFAYIVNSIPSKVARNSFCLQGHHVVQLDTASGDQVHQTYALCNQQYLFNIQEWRRNIHSIAQTALGKGEGTVAYDDSGSLGCSDFSFNISTNFWNTHTLSQIKIHLSLDINSTEAIGFHTQIRVLVCLVMAHWLIYFSCIWQQAVNGVLQSLNSGNKALKVNKSYGGKSAL